MASEAIVRIEETENQALTPMGMIEIAIRQNADIDKLEKLLSLQQRWEANEARKAFVAAMNAFKANPPQLEKIKKVDFSSKDGNRRVNYNYAPLDYIAKALGEALSRHGLSFRWNVEQKEGVVRVTCVLQHRDGHNEAVTMEGLPHSDERMNAIQRLGATVTYLERYTLLAATGMATQEQDTDGNGVITMGGLSEKLEWIDNCSTLEELKRIFEAAYREAEKAKDMRAMNALVARKDARKKALQ